MIDTQPEAKPVRYRVVRAGQKGCEPFYGSWHSVRLKRMLENNIEAANQSLGRGTYWLETDEES